MIPPRNRRIIEAVFEEYGRDIELRMDEDAPDFTFYVVGEYGEKPYVVGSVRYINHARDYLTNSFVPECFADEAQTWG